MSNAARFEIPDSADGSHRYRYDADTDAFVLDSPEIPVIDIRDYEVDPTGNNDSTAGIQAAIDDSISSGDPASTSRTGQYKLYMPVGDYVLTEPVRVESVFDYAIEGDGPGLTRLKAGAADMECLLDLNGVAYSRFSGFTLAGNDGGGFSCTRALWLRFNGVNRSTTRNSFDNVHVRNLKYVKAFELGDASEQGVQVDQDAFHSCHATGAWTTGETTWYQSGFHCGDGTHANNLMHNFFGCTSITNRTNVYNDASSVSWYGGCVQNAERDFFLNSQRFLKASGFRSEGSERLLETGGPATFSSHASFEDIDWVPNELNADGGFILWKYGGHLSLRSVSVQFVTGAAPKITTSASSNHMVTLDQCSSQSTVDDFLSIAANGRSEIWGYVQLTTGNAASTMTGLSASGLIARSGLTVGSASGPTVTSGTGSPEGVVTAPQGSLFLRTDGSTSTTLYVKTSGSGNTGWTAK